MYQFTRFLLSVICLGLPIFLIVYIAVTYNMALGNLSIVGITKQDINKKKHWTNVAGFTAKIGSFVSLSLSAIGAVLALLGFFTPWVNTTISTSMHDLDLTGINGSQSGLGLLFQSIASSYKFFGSNEDGAFIFGIVFILIALLMVLTFLSLLITFFMGVGLILVPFGNADRNADLLGNRIQKTAMFSLLFCFVLFLIIQATGGGIEISGSQELLDFSFSSQASLASGFGITIWSLVIAILGALGNKSLVERYMNWISSLTELDVN